MFSAIYAISVFHLVGHILLAQQSTNTIHVLGSLYQGHAVAVPYVTMNSIALWSQLTDPTHRNPTLQTLTNVFSSISIPARWCRSNILD